MADNSKKLSELPTASNAASSDRVLILRDPAGSPSTRTISLDNLTSSIRYANTTLAGVVKVGNNLTINATGYLNAEAGGAANTGNFTFSNNILYVPSWSEISTAREANTPYSISYYDQNYWGAYAELDTPGGNNSWAWIETNNSDINNPFILHEVLSYNGDYATWRFYANGVLDLPFDIGDIQRNGVSLIGTGQIDGGNAFTTPTAEITVDGGGA
jgi:hypothetical protein